MINRRLIGLALPLTLAAALGLTACGDDDSGSGGKPTYKIAYQGPLSGGNQALGINMDRGVKLAVQQANEAGDLPFTLEFTDADDLGTGDGSPPAARKLISDGDVVAVVGPAFSGASNAAGPLWKDAGMLAVTPSATLPDLTTHGFDTWWRAVATDNAQGPPDAEYLMEVVGAKRIFVVDDTTDYGKGLAKAFSDQVKKEDASKLVGSDSGPQTAQCAAGATGSTSQYPTIASKVQGANADAVFYAGYYCDLALMAKALNSAGFKGQIMSGDGSKDATYIKQAGAKVANGTLISCQCSDSASIPAAADFQADYKAAYGADPGAYSAEAFDVANAIISKMKTIGADVTRENLLASWPDVSYKGLTKTVEFAPDHELKEQAAFLYQVKDGELAYLGNLEELL